MKDLSYVHRLAGDGIRDGRDIFEPLPYAPTCRKAVCGIAIDGKGERVDEALAAMTRAPVAILPDCSTSRVVSKEPDRSPGAPGPPSTLITSTRWGSIFSPTAFQYAKASLGVKLAKVIIPTVRPFKVMMSRRK
jgi:hypothetical protein